MDCPCLPLAVGGSEDMGVALVAQPVLMFIAVLMLMWMIAQENFVLQYEAVEGRPNLQQLR